MMKVQHVMIGEFNGVEVIPGGDYYHGTEKLVHILRRFINTPIDKKECGDRTEEQWALQELIRDAGVASFTPEFLVQAVLTGEVPKEVRAPPCAHVTVAVVSLLTTR